jgi:peroxiredoxin
LAWGEDWRVASEPAADVGIRPDLDSLGVFRWEPSPAPDWTLKDDEGHSRSLAEYRGEPLVVIFYLGYGCLHCAEQLHEFAPMTERFQDAGIRLLAISTDDEVGLQVSVANYEAGGLPFPLLSNSELDVFRSYRAYDDFEQQPLHGTFLLDGEGRIRWQDISYEPFMDAAFVLQEAKRLLQR